MAKPLASSRPGAPRRALGHKVSQKRYALKQEIETAKKARRERDREAARRMMDRASILQQVVPTDPLRWGRGLISAALDSSFSVGLLVDIPHHIPLHVEWAETTGGWTDFSKIHVNVAEDLIPENKYDPDLIKKVATARGLLYHEMGHIRYSVHPTNILPINKAAQFPPTNETPWVAQSGVRQVAWNILEDQRMEHLSVLHHPRHAPFFTTLVTSLILEQTQTLMNGGPEIHPSPYVPWLLLAGREYLPDSARLKAFKMFVDFALKQDEAVNGLGSSHYQIYWEQKAEEWFSLVIGYRRATNTPQLAFFIEEAEAFLRNLIGDLALGSNSISNGVDAHGTGEGESRGSAAPGAKQDGQNRGGNMPTKPDAKEGDGGGVAAGKDADMVETDQSLIDLLRKLEQRSFEVIKGYSDTKNMISEYVDMTEASVSFPPPPDGLSQPMTAEVLAEAETMAEDMKKALASFMTRTEPFWVEREPQGVIDVMAYRTKQTGDQDFRRFRMPGNEGKGRNVHVSLMCDVSGSMSGENMLALSIALYAIASACRDLDIRSHFTLWSTSYYGLWEGSNPDPVVWNSMGGTQPEPALEDMMGHNTEGAEHHLVLVFTDGQWYNVPPLTNWSAPGRKIVVLHYGQYELPQPTGADEEIRVTDIRALPDLLSNYITEAIEQ